MEWLAAMVPEIAGITAVGLQLTRFAEDLSGEALEVIRHHLPASDVILLNHHLCHASSAYFTSPFDSAAILSIDGWGNDGPSVGFAARGNEIVYTRRWHYSLGLAYRALGTIIGGIESADLETAGKTMGLASYGKIREDWIDPISRFIREYRPRRDVLSSWEPAVADGRFYLPGFGAVRGANAFGGPEDPLAQDFAATFQLCWTTLVLELASELRSITQMSNVCLTGGAALNVVANSALVKSKIFDRVHFIPNPNDAGLSVGAALYYFYGYDGAAWKPATGGFCPFVGPEPFDLDDLSSLAASRKAEQLGNPAAELARLLGDGQIVGLIQGRAEIGPRALGGRSILASPDLAHTRERLNHRVKRREWYRPFALVLRMEDVAIYLNAEMESPYMSLVATVRPEWRPALQGVTHFDGTARYQTVMREASPFLHDVLTELERLGRVPVLLNTSFNGPGEPIIGRISEALALLDTAELDAVFAEGILFARG